MIALYLALLPGMKKRAEAEQKAEAEKKDKALNALHEPPSVPKGDHPDTGTDEAFMAAFTAAMIYHEIHGHHRSEKSGTMTATDDPDDDSYYADPYEERHDDDFF